MTRTALLLGAASAIAVAAPSQSATFLFPQTGTVPANQEITADGVTQVVLDNGAVVSIVGPAAYSIEGGQLSISRGGVTIVATGTTPVTVHLPGGATVEVAGAGALNVTGQGFTGNVMGGTMTARSGGSAETFRAGQSWSARTGAAPSLVFANAAQMTPLGPGGKTIAELAVDGFPITLGEALASVGASGDLLAAASNLEAYLANPALGTLPSGDLDALIGFLDRLAAALGGSSFDGANPAIINAYLQFLVSGGQAADFQSAYTALVTQYLTLLAAGGVPADFDAVNLDLIGAYLSYLESSGALGQIAEAQQAILAAYLEFLAGGGLPTEFVTPAELLDEDVLAAYVAAIEAYITFLSQGGNPADFATDPDLIAAYIQNLVDSGLLDTLLAGQAEALEAYLAFLAGGGDPADFDGFGLSEELAQAYAEAITAFLAFIETGGIPSEFGGLSGEIFIAYLEALQTAGLFDSLFGDQADFLAAYLAFLQGGGDIDDFDQLPDPITDEQKLAALAAFEQFIRDGGVPSEYDGEAIATLAAYFEDGDVQADYASNDVEAQTFFTAFFFFAQGNDPDAFAALPSNGGGVVQVATTVAFSRDGAGASVTSRPAQFVLVDNENKPITGPLSGVPTASSTIALSDGAVQSEYFATDDGDVSVTRLTGTGFTEGGQSFDVGANQGIHYAWVPALPALPGDVTVYYDQLFATSPTFVDGSGAPGTFDADVAVNFEASGATRLAIEGMIAMPGDATYDFSTDGGIAGVADLDASSFISANSPRIAQSAITLTGTGKACLAGASCTMSLFAMPGGEGAEYLGLSYQTLNGGDGAVQIVGAAAFQAGSAPGTGGGGGDIAGAGFDTSFAGTVYAFPYDQSGTLRTLAIPSFGQLDRDASGRITRVNYVGSDQIRFDPEDTELLSQIGDDDALLLVYGPGDVTALSSPFTVLGNSIIASVSGNGAVLPISGTATFDILYKTPAYSTDAGLADGVFDAQIAVAFGSVPRVGIEGTITMDEVYAFTTPGGLADPEAKVAITQGQFFTSGSLTGTGAVCSSGTCGFNLRGIFNDTFNRIATVWETSSTDILVYGGAIFGTDTVDGLSFDGGSGTSSGALSAAFGLGENLTMTFVDGGGLNRKLTRVTSWPVDAAFDERGVTTISRGGTLTFARDDLSVAELAGTEDWQIARWNGGELGGSLAFGGSIYDANSGFHYALTTPFTGTLPMSGRINYTLLGATSPTYADGQTAPGMFAGEMAILLGSTNKVGLEATVTMADAVYAFQTNGGLADISSSFMTLDGSNSFRRALNLTSGTDGAACANTVNCTALVQGQLGGEAGAYASLAYAIGNTQSVDPYLTGAAVFGGEYEAGTSDLPEGTAREDQVVAYAATVVGIDSRNTSTVIYSDTTGAPLAHQWNLNDFTMENERPNIGSNTEHETGSVDGIIGWTRWAGGETGGNYYGNTVTIAENSGWHEVAGTPATNLPASGTINYTLIGSTAPTIRDGSVAPGTFTGELAVAFGSTPMVGVEFDVAIGGSGYAINTPGGIADPMNGGLPVSTDSMEFGTVFDQPVIVSVTSGAGEACSGSGDCRVDIRGFLAGEGASHAGVTYTFGNTGFDTQIDGAAAFAADN